VATLLLALVVTEVAVTTVAAAAAGLTWTALVDLLVLSNTLLGLSLAAAGWPIARHQPANLVGWSLLLGGCAYAFSGYLFYGPTARAWPGSGGGVRRVALIAAARGWLAWLSHGVRTAGHR
jgi:hypothetical protein